jgi:ribosomal protein S18 acetylase RimI-like enzyme
MEYKIKKIQYEETYYLRHSVMNPEKKLSEMKRSGDETALHFGAILENRIVGIVSFYETNPNEWRIRGIAVDPHFQGTGIGKALINHAVIEIRGVKRIWCNSRIGAVSFYENLGFTVISKKVIIHGFGERIQMELKV